MKKISDFFAQKMLSNKEVSRNLLILLSLFLLSTLIIVLFSIFVLQNVLTNSYLFQKNKQDRFYFWIEKVENYPNSPDVLYNAAISALEINKNETALKLVKQALIYDPLFTEAIGLQQEIIEKSR